MLELDSGVCCGELPICLGGFCVAVLPPCVDFLGESFLTQSAEAVKKISPIRLAAHQPPWALRFPKAATSLGRGRNHPGDDRIPPRSSHGAIGVSLDLNLFGALGKKPYFRLYT